MTEWEINPAGVPRARHGTGRRFRQRTLALSEHPAFLCRLGGPFFLFQCKVTALGALRDPNEPL
ncbi:hypothetical protein D9753_35305 [Streptomyces dangxiongensis]|uniref:Uncharacterized protein n=1 Tax=Streptomyces dangxiongensis TaxID=1442032 RepID=A0A3G2JPA5_9ACTN|nr:hypothetical protein D9753_35305 [Streptomyces dangxiongensis]